MTRMALLCSLTLLLSGLVSASAAVDAGSAPDYTARVAPILKKYCAGCHNDEDREGKFSLENYASLHRGTAHGPAFLPGDAKGSRIIRVLTGAAKPTMPPEDEPRPAADEIALIAAWIEAGARGPQGQAPDRLSLVVPKIAGHVKAQPVVAMDATRDGRWLAVARGDRVGLYSGRRSSFLFTGAHDRAIPRQGHRVALHPRRQATRNRLRGGGIRRRRGNLERRRWHARRALRGPSRHPL